MPVLTRRNFLQASLASATLATLAACSDAEGQADGLQRILPGDPLVAEFEERRLNNGMTVARELIAGDLTRQIDGTRVNTLGYNGALNGPLLRATMGDRLEVWVDNQLGEGTSVHWHGLALRNDADGVQGLTQEPIAANDNYMYGYQLTHPGTYWYHSHFDMQRERALYGALVVEDPNEPLVYDKDWVIILDDWMDGITGTPEEVFDELSQGMPMSDDMSGMEHGSMSGMEGDMGGETAGHMLMGSNSDYLGGDAGDVRIPVHLFNGRSSSDPDVLDARPGDRVRLRIINAAGDTAYRVGIPGQKLTLTHTDGFPAKHQDADAVVLGMGERIDALITVQDGQTPLVGLPEGKEGQAHGIISTGVGSAPSPDQLPSAFEGMVTDGGQLKADESVSFDPREPDRTHEMHLTGTMEAYDWGINGRRFDMSSPFEGAFELKIGERVRVNITNDTHMWHPVHLHGHTFQLANQGARKDTVMVRPNETVTIDFEADNPGQWLAHCHNAYHADAGMMAVFSYIH